MKLKTLKCFNAKPVPDGTLRVIFFRRSEFQGKESMSLQEWKTVCQCINIKNMGFRAMCTYFDCYLNMTGVVVMMAAIIGSSCLNDCSSSLTRFGLT